jgi:hypothetical protein
MDLNLIYPIVLSWWTSNTTLITAIITILASTLGAIIGANLTNRWKKESDFFNSKRRAYYRYVEVFSDTSRIKEWTPSLISEKLFILWKTALEVGEFGGEIGNLAFDVNLNDVLNDVENEPSLEGDLCSRLRTFSYYCNVNKNSIIRIKSFYGFIELIEAVLRIDPSKVKMDDLLKVGQEYFPIFRNILLNEDRMVPKWKLWHKKKFDLFKSPMDEEIKTKNWWMFWK